MPPGAAAKGGDEAVGGGEQDCRSKQTSGEGCARWRTTSGEGCARWWTKPAGGMLPGGHEHDRRRGRASRQGRRRSREVSNRPSPWLPFRARAASSPSYPSRARLPFPRSKTTARARPRERNISRDRLRRPPPRRLERLRAPNRRLRAAWNRLGAAIAWSSAYPLI